MSVTAELGRSELLALNRRLTKKAAQLEAVNVELEQIGELYSTVMENMVEGLYVVDPAGRMLLMNSAASTLLGWSREELLGRSLHDIVHGRHASGSPRSTDECELVSAYRDGGTVHCAWDTFVCKDGSLIPVAYSASPLASGGRMRGAVIVFRDITAELDTRRRAESELHTLVWVGRVREALDGDRMRLYSQPIVPLRGGARSEELLLRMLTLEGELVSPDAFLPTAERHGLIGEIDGWVVGKAIRLAAAGRRVEINLSAASVGDRQLLALIEHELRGGEADPANLVFEITETALMRDVDAGEAFTRALTEMGCKLALDDFGTGFGSFTYLKRFPISYLKIDIEFVRHLASNPANQHLVKAIVNLAEGFGHETIAEGVEDEETLALLRDYGVDYAQGFHLGPPAPSDGAPA